MTSGCYLLSGLLVCVLLSGSFFHAARMTMKWPIVLLIHNKCRPRFGPADGQWQSWWNSSSGQTMTIGMVLRVCARHAIVWRMRSYSTTHDVIRWWYSGFLFPLCEWVIFTRRFSEQCMAIVNIGMVQRHIRRTLIIFDSMRDRQHAMIS